MSCLNGRVVIIQNTSSLEKLEDLRAQIADNSETIINLFRQRSQLAREIGDLKRELGLSPRIREREESVLDALGDMDIFSKSIISSLFEFSIVNEIHNHGSVNSGIENRMISVRGTRNNLEFLAGFLITKPGTQVYSEGKLPLALEEGIQLNGGHIVQGNHSEPDLTICLNGIGKECDIAISESSEMTLKLVLPLNHSERIVRVRQ